MDPCSGVLPLRIMHAWFLMRPSPCLQAETNYPRQATAERGGSTQEPSPAPWASALTVYGVGRGLSLQPDLERVERVANEGDRYAACW
jgi:hypothetical protein